MRTASAIRIPTQIHGDLHRQQGRRKSRAGTLPDAPAALADVALAGSAPPPPPPARAAPSAPPPHGTAGGRTSTRAPARRSGPGPASVPGDHLLAAAIATEGIGIAQGSGPADIHLAGKEAAEAAAGAGAADSPGRGGGVVGVSAQQKPTRQPRSGAVGQWAGVVRIVRALARGRPCQRGSPITGAGLDPSSTPAGIPSNGSDGEGCWGGSSSRDGRQRRG